MNSSRAGSSPSATDGSIIAVTAFVDWNSQIYMNSTKKGDDPLIVAQMVLTNTANRIAKFLYEQESAKRFRVRLRLYHGWHRGFEPTSNKKAIKSILASADYSTLSHVKNVVFEENVEYGDCLLSAMPDRMHAALGIHLPNTLRNQGRSDTEKMVDTAMAADMVRSAALDPEDWILVLAEDDDLVPPLFTAEALMKNYSSRVIMLHHRPRSGNFLKLSKLVARI